MSKYKHAMSCKAIGGYKSNISNFIVLSGEFRQNG